MSNLPTVTEEDIARRPEQLRKTARGGWAWKCSKCGQYASSLTQAGLRCYQHGGTRKSTRDPMAAVKAQAEGKEPPRPPGRPMKTGWYSEGEMRNVHEIVEEYRASGKDPDSTDEDMLYLRARLQNMQNLGPSAAEIAELLTETLEEMREWRDQKVDAADGRTVDDVLAALGRYQEMINTADRGARALAKYLSLEGGLDERNSNLVVLAQKRADTRLKNKAGEQLEVFTLMLGRLMQILSEALPPEDFLGLQRRMIRDLDQIPRRALEPATIDTATINKPSGKTEG